MGRLDGFDNEFSKPWERGWYRGAVVEEYTGQDGKMVFRTEDRQTQKPETRQLQLCMVLANANGGGKPETKYLNYSVFYRPESLFDNDRVKYVMEQRGKEPKRGKWSDTDAQRDNMSFIALHEVEKAINEGNELEQADNSGLDTSSLPGAELDAFISIFRKGDKGYHEEVPKDIIDDYFKGLIKWGKDGTESWFYQVKYIAPVGSMTDKK